MKFDQSSVLVLLQDYLLENNLVATCRALELESGCSVGQNNEVRPCAFPTPSGMALFVAPLECTSTVIRLGAQSYPAPLKLIHHTPHAALHFPFTHPPPLSLSPQRTYPLPGV